MKSHLKIVRMVSQQEGRIHVGPLKTDGYAEARGEDGRQRIKGKQKGRKW